MQLGATRPEQRRGAKFESVPLDDVIQTDVATVTEDTEVSDIVESMADHNVGSVVVVDDDNRPQGLITDRKIALSLRESPDITDRLAREFTQDELVTGPTEMTVYDAINELSQESIRRLPVVDNDGTLAGIVTLDDILVLLSMELDTAADVIEAQSPGL
jgi:CBS domain-containing protein